jgi:hypothetical protein
MEGQCADLYAERLSGSNVEKIGHLLRSQVNPSQSTLPTERAFSLLRARARGYRSGPLRSCWGGQPRLTCGLMACHRDQSECCEQPAASRAIRLRMTPEEGAGEESRGGMVLTRGGTHRRGCDFTFPAELCWTATVQPEALQGGSVSFLNGIRQSPEVELLDAQAAPPNRRDLSACHRERDLGTWLGREGSLNGFAAGEAVRRPAEPGNQDATWQVSPGCSKLKETGSRRFRGSVVKTGPILPCRKRIQSRKRGRARIALRWRRGALAGFLGGILHLMMMVAPAAPETFVSISPLEGAAVGGPSTTMRGVGFARQTTYSCAFTDVRRSANTVEIPASFVSDTALQCEPLAWPHPAATTLVSLRANGSIEVRTLSRVSSNTVIRLALAAAQRT